MSVWIVNGLGLLLIAVIVFWFSGWTPRQQRQQDTPSEGSLRIRVEHGVYEPDTVTVRAGERITLLFDRRDAGPCAEQVVFDGLNQNVWLPLNQTTPVTLNPDTPGDYPFTCAMRMYRGLLRVLPPG